MSDISIANGEYLPAVTDLYPLHAAGAALVLAGIEPQIAGGVLAGDDVLVAVAIPAAAGYATDPWRVICAADT